MVTSLPFNLRQAVRDTNRLGYHTPAETNVTIRMARTEPPNTRIMKRAK